MVDVWRPELQYGGFRACWVVVYEENYGVYVLGLKHAQSNEVMATVDDGEDVNRLLIRYRHLYKCLWLPLKTKSAFKSHCTLIVPPTLITSYKP